MSQTEEDRAAKAARGKALLLKRQQKKASGTGSRGTPPPSRSHTPSLAEPAATVTEQVKRERNINDLFNSSSDVDANWIQSLPRAEVPDGVNTIAEPQPESPGPRPSPRSPPPPQERVGTPASASHPVTTSLANHQALDDLHIRLAEQRQLVASLKNENSTLQSSLTRFNEIQAVAREKDKALQEERVRCKALEDKLARAAESHVVVTRRLEELSREKSQLEDLQDDAQSTISKLETGHLELEQRLSEAGRKVDSLQSDIRRLASDLGSVQGEVLNAWDHSRKVELELSTARSQIEELHANAARDSKRWQEQDQSRQQTISLLVSEKASLITSVQRLEEVEIELQEKESSFLAEQTKATNLAKSVQEFEIITLKQRNELEETLSRERELLERVRDHEREIQLRKAEFEEVQAASSQHQQRVRELEEQIESDDRADKLEVSLKNTQDRADELEFQLSKVQQLHAAAKGERDNLESQLRSMTQSEADWKVRHSSLQTEHSAMQGHLQAANGHRDALVEERASLQSQVEFNQSAVKQLQQKLGELASEVTSSDRTLQNVQSELRAALRRGEESEKTQMDLQAEGTRLVQSLEEMQPKIVELTSVKLELMEQIERLEHEKRSRDTLISKLEMALNEGTEREAEASKLRKESDTLRERDNHSLQQSVAELQRGYSLLEAELQTAQATTKTLETERVRMRQTEVRQADLSNRMSAEARRREEEISQLESALAASRKNEADQSQLIHHYRTELESVQSELVAKEEELESVRSDGGDHDHHDHDHDRENGNQGLRSLDDEMLSAVKQQHAMELSSAHSQVRALESAVFEAQDRAHRLQRQVHVLEEQLASRSLSRASSQRPFSPAGSSSSNARPASRTSSDLRRGSLASTTTPIKSSNLVPPTRSVFDVGLSPEARHKRQVSLSMLKARIESETAAHRHTPPPPPRGLSPIPDSSISETDSPHSHRPQFMDESHIFWCHSCRGELVIL